MNMRGEPRKAIALLTGVLPAAVIHSKKERNRRPGSSQRMALHGFNELDNWMGIMEVDPPKNREDKWGMYLRLNEIVEGLLAGQQQPRVQPLIPPRTRRHPLHSIG